MANPNPGKTLDQGFLLKSAELLNLLSHSNDTFNFRATRGHKYLPCVTRKHTQKKSHLVAKVAWEANRR